MDETLGVNESGFAEQTESTSFEQTETPETVETNEAQQPEVAEPARATQDRDTNAAFAQMQTEAEQAKRDRDALIAEIYGETHGIKTYEQYTAAKQRAEAEARAQKVGVDPDFYQEVMNLRDQFAISQREKNLIEQERQLESDPAVGEIYKEFKDEVHQMAQQFNCDYDTAFTLLTRQKLADLMTRNSQKAEQKALSNVINRNKKQVETMGEGGNVGKIDVNSLSDAQIDEIAQRALRGERITL